MPQPPAPLRTISPVSDRPTSPQPVLRVIPGGRNQPSMTFVATGYVDELRLELTASQAERTAYAARARELLRSAMRHIASGHYAAAGTVLVELDRLTAKEIQRALSIEAPACPDALEGMGHGRAA